MVITCGSDRRDRVELFLIFILLLLTVVQIYFSPIGVSFMAFTNNFINKVNATVNPNVEKIRPPEQVVFELHCSTTGDPETCAVNYPSQPNFLETKNTTCPNYFQWIYEDLKPWKATGITREMIKRARATAHFHLVIRQGRIYVDYFERSFETRDVFTIWGFVQLVRMYPGMVPDVELLFNCGDRPVTQAEDYAEESNPPPTFGYCKDAKSLDILFPDWSFWGWAEVNIKPWNHLAVDIRRGNQMVKFVDREPYAYWKGNPTVAPNRMDLLTCNVTEENDWKARLYDLNWNDESHKLFNNSGLANQCMHRYKIYIEGYGWSVSQKYILACNSLTLLVKPQFYEFFSRGLEPLKHYWPIRDEEKCKSIKYAVDWGNSHTKEAEEIGKAASDFVLNDMNMKYVYDYMYHLLHRYHKLQRFDPEIPPGGVEVCAETMACTSTGMQREFMAESLVNRPASSPPCRMPDYHPLELSESYKKNMDTISMVEGWEQIDQP